MRTTFVGSICELSMKLIRTEQILIVALSMNDQQIKS